MTTNLLIAYPSVLRDAESITSTADYEAERPLLNIVTGGRQKTARVDPGDYRPIITVQMESGDERQVEFMVVAKAKQLLAIGGNQFYLSIESPMAETKALGTEFGLQTRTLLGPREEDLIFTTEINNQFAVSLPTTAAQIFRIYYGTTASLPPEEAPFWEDGLPIGGVRNPDAENYFQQFWEDGSPGTELPQFFGYEGELINANWEVSKIYLGRFFDMGRDPLYPRTYTRDATSGSEKRVRRKFELRWDDITNAKVQELQKEIIRYKDIAPVFLYTKQHHEILQGERLVHCKILNVNIFPQYPNSNVVQLTFEELI